MKQKLQCFIEWKVIRVSRDENSRANVLTRVTAFLEINWIVTLLVYYRAEPLILGKERVCQFDVQDGS